MVIDTFRMGVGRTTFRPVFLVYSQNDQLHPVTACNGHCTRLCRGGGGGGGGGGGTTYQGGGGEDHIYHQKVAVLPQK